MADDYHLPNGYKANLREKLADLFRLGTDKDKVAAFYDEWAETYEQDLVHPGFKPPLVTVQEMTTLFPEDHANIRVLDGGSGTGCMGEALYKAGFTNLDALDPSQGMLDVSAKKNVYQKLVCDFLGVNRLPIEDDAYDACVLVGCFVPGHAKSDCFEELIRITKPGGVILMLTRERYFLEDPDLRQMEPSINRLAQAGKWNIHTRRIIDKSAGNENGILIILKIL